MESMTGKSLDLEAIRSRCDGDNYPGSECYKMFVSLGVNLWSFVPGYTSPSL